MNAQAPEMLERDQPKAESSPPFSSCDLFEAFLRPDHGLELAIATAENFLCGLPGSNLHRGLYITKAEANRLLSNAPGSLAWPSVSSSADETASAQAVENRLWRLTRVFGLFFRSISEPHKECCPCGGL
jgi:hypothetical protein